ncbi:MAG: NfeD family protein [Bacilli bacterium]|nr:NfeD family protein [Bacilli bacterium]
MSLFWVIIILVLSIIEVATINLVTIWYVASAIVALITSFFIDSFEIEFSIFVILGTIFLVTTKKTLDKLVKEHHEKTNLDRIVGMEGIVTEDISRNKIGAVKVDGKEWSATANKKISAGEIVKVLEINSTKLKVEKIEEE